MGDIMMHVGGTMSTSEDVQYIGGYHEYIGGYRGMFSTLGFSIEIERFLQTCSPTWHHDIPWCTEHSSMYSWYPLTCIMISPDVLNTPNVLMISPQCAHDIPPMCSWYPPNVLNTSRYNEHTLYRVRSSSANINPKCSSFTCWPTGMTEVTPQIQLTNRVKFGSRYFRSIENGRVHKFHSKQFSSWQAWKNSILHNHSNKCSESVYWCGYLIITWIITSYLENFYRHN